MSESLECSTCRFFLATLATFARLFRFDNFAILRILCTSALSETLLVAPARSWNDISPNNTLLGRLYSWQSLKT